MNSLQSLKRLADWAESQNPGVTFGGDHPVAVARAVLEEADLAQGRMFLQHIKRIEFPDGTFEGHPPVITAHNVMEALEFAFKNGGNVVWRHR